MLQHEGLNRRTALTVMGAGLLSVAPEARAANSVRKARLEGAIEAMRVAMVAGDGKTIDGLVHAQLNYMHSSGFSQTKEKLLADLAGKKFFESLTYANLAIDIVPGAGIVKFSADQVKNLPGGGTRPSRIIVLQTWLEHGKSWQLLTRASALISSGTVSRRGS